MNPKNPPFREASINIVRQWLPASVLGMYIHVNTLIEIEYGCSKVYRSMHSSSLSENSWVTSICIKKQNWDFSGGPVDKNPGDTGSIPGPGRFHMLRGN